METQRMYRTAREERGMGLVVMTVDRRGSLRRWAMLGVLLASCWALSASLALGQLGDRALPEECGTLLNEESAQAMRWLHERGLYSVPASKYAFWLPIAVHVVRQSDGAGGLTVPQVDQAILAINDEFISAGMQFFQQGATDYIDNDNFYFNIDTQAEIDALRSTNTVAGAVNLYFTLNLANEKGALAGISSFTPDAVQGIVIENDDTPAFGNSSTAPHEMGHYFDLYHTHETAFGVECPDGTNCGSAGDLLCDTPADPKLDGSNVTGCDYSGSETLCGDPVSPDPTNLMSYGPKSCRTQFTAGQLSRALATLVNLRPGLIQAPGLSVTWVDFNHGGVESGTYAKPFKTLAEGLAATAHGGTIVIKGGTSPETPDLDTPVNIEAFRFTSTIGAAP